VLVLLGLSLPFDAAFVVGAELVVVSLPSPPRPHCAARAGAVPSDLKLSRFPRPRLAFFCADSAQHGPRLHKRYRALHNNRRSLGELGMETDPGHVRFIVLLADGTEHLMEIDTFTLRNGDSIALMLATANQEAGSIPAGDILSIRRMRSDE
jgi:hypothetical protein